MAKREKNPNTLWTKDFTIITLGSVVSMFGNAMSGFALSLMVLDYTQSPLFFAIYVAIFTLPQIIMPIFSGAILDRFSRKKTIYTLDFISAGLYALVALLIWRGMFSFVLFAIYAFILGSINSIYMVAFESFYPLLITEGNYSKAYSISSLLETLSAVMVPVSTYFYNLVGIAPLLGVNAVCFFIAAVMETRIGAEEKYIEKRKLEEDTPASGKRLLRDIKEGFKYLLSEKGLLAVAVYFTFSSIASGASSVITLPFFKGTFDNGEYIYMLVWGMALVGRAVGGAVHYRIHLPVKAKYAGLGGVTSYTIRISSTQSYVPDEKKGRFNGAFNMLNTTGAFAGELLAGALTTVIPVRGVLTCFMVMNAVAAVAIIGGSWKSVSAIYNRDQ